MSSSFVGRVHDPAVDRALDDVLTGSPALAVVEGETGMGKTAVVDALSERVQQLPSSPEVWRCRCTDTNEAGPPGWAIVDGIRARRPELLEGHRPSADGTEPAGAVFEQVIGAVRVAAEQGPVVMIIDDLHWADGATRDLLPFLLSSLDDARLMIVGTVAVDQVGRGHPLRAVIGELRRRPNCHVVTLAPLERSDVALLAGTPPARRDRAVTNIWRRTGGNPFLVTELPGRSPRGWRHRLRRRLDRASAVRDLLLDRIEAVTEPVRQVLAAVSVAGDGVTHRLLLDVVALPTPISTTRCETQSSGGCW